MNNRYLCVIGAILLNSFLFSLAGCATPSASGPKAVQIPIDAQYKDIGKNTEYLVTSTSQRIPSDNACESYFSRERAAIDERRKDLPPNERDFGLALSGGGIRSNAFQLGLMSGLYQEGYLKRVDYISAVSGGSWAAAAYKASTKSDDQFFHDLNKATGIPGKDDNKAPVVYKSIEYNDNDKSIRPLFNSYRETLAQIERLKSNLGLRVGFSSQEAWRKMLKTNVLDDHDVLLKNLNKDEKSKGSVKIFV